MKYQPVLDIISERLEQLKSEIEEFERFGAPNPIAVDEARFAIYELTWLWDKINRL